MSNEIKVHGVTGYVLYALVRNASGQVWRPSASAFENYNAANYANYATAISLTEQGATGLQLGSFPAGITAAGVYDIDVRRQSGGSPAVSDLSYGGGVLKWDGTAEIVHGDVNVVQWRGSQPNNLTSGRVEVLVGAMSNGVVTASAVATDAIDADALATDAVSEIQSGLATAAGLSAIATTLTAITNSLTMVTNRIGAFTGSGVNTILGFLKALMSKAAATPSDVGGTFDASSDSTEAIRDQGDAAWTGAVPPTASAIADAVWDEALAGHATAGSAGAALSAAGSAGDPWATELPGTYEPGQAGYIVGVNLDAQISALIGGPYAAPSFEGACANVQYFDAGEIKPVADRLVATNGTFTISAATVTLRNGDGDVVYGINGLNATGFDIGALVSPRAWYVLNTANPPSGGPIAAGTYELEFSIVGTASDGEDRTLILAVTIVVS